MKKYLIALTLFIAVAVAFADVWVYQSDGTRYSHNYSTFDSLSRVAPGTLALSQPERIVPFEGETFNLDIYANQSWTASVSDASRIQLSKTHGNGKDVISVTVAANKQDEQVYDTITVRLADGTQNAIYLTVEAWQDDLAVNPLSQKFPPAGGTFKVGITSNTSWAIDNSADWVSLDKTSGTLNDSITVTVSPSDTYKTTQSILTVTTPNKTILHSIVTRIGDELSVIPSSQTFSPLGGSYKIYVSSNTDWTVSASEPWITFDKTNGTLNDSIVVKVGKGDKDAASATITVSTTNGCTLQCGVQHENDSISVSLSSEKFPFEGGNTDVMLYCNTDWTASVDKDWVSISQNVGYGDKIIAIKVDAGVNKSKCDTSIVKFITSLGKISTIYIYRSNYTGEGEDVTDINGRSYPTVWINGQNWMAENLKCDKYDTESEAYNASWLSDNRIPISSSNGYTPYHIDATVVTSDNLTYEQIANLGYQYNWAAVVGVKDGRCPDGGHNSTDDVFSGSCMGEILGSYSDEQRQGICPNGWHVPSDGEWCSLCRYVSNKEWCSLECDCPTNSMCYNNVGKELKTTTGWYENGNGIDIYGFAVLPLNGYRADFWTSSPYGGYRFFGNVFSFFYNRNYVESHYYYVYPSNAYSVRCLRN